MKLEEAKVAASAAEAVWRKALAEARSAQARAQELQEEAQKVDTGTTQAHVCWAQAEYLTPSTA